MEYLPWVLMALGLFLLFVTNQSRSTEAFSRRKQPDYSVSYSEAPQHAPVLPEPPRDHASNIWMPIILSLLITGAALVVILLPAYYGEAQQKWAFGIIGLILGYWFKK